MTRLTKLAAAFAIGTLMFSPIVGATSADAAKMTKEEKAAVAAKKAEEKAAHKKKVADCKAKSKEEKLGKRRAAYKECMKAS